MAKRASDHPKLLMRRTLQGLSPVTAYDEERLSSVGLGSAVEVQVFQQRSVSQLRLYWVVLHFCVDNSEGKYGRAEDLHDALKVSLGYTRKIRLLVSEGNQAKAVIRDAVDRILTLVETVTSSTVIRKTAKMLCDRIAQRLDDIGDAETIILPGSISLDKMDQSEFKAYFDRAMGELTKAGYPIDDFIREGKAQLAPRRYVPTATNRNHHHGEPYVPQAAESRHRPSA